MTPPPDEASPLERVEDLPRILQAMRDAVREALLRHKRLGNPVAVWRDGGVVWLSPEAILTESVESDPSHLRRPPPHSRPLDWRSRITVEPGKRGGAPCLRGLRITVGDVLEYLASGMSEDEILQRFPDLTRDDIRACLAFAADRERKPEPTPPP